MGEIVKFYSTFCFPTPERKLEEMAGYDAAEKLKFAMNMRYWLLRTEGNPYTFKVSMKGHPDAHVHLARFGETAAHAMWGWAPTPERPQTPVLAISVMLSGLDEKADNAAIDNVHLVLSKGKEPAHALANVLKIKSDSRRPLMVFFPMGGSYGMQGPPVQYAANEKDWAIPFAAQCLACAFFDQFSLNEDTLTAPLP
jgi:hypothetical protein